MVKRVSWAVACLVIVGCVCMIGSTVFAQSSGKQAPSFTLVDLDNNTVELAGYADTPVLMFFWTTWCPYCRIEMSQLSKNYDALQADGLAVLVINTGEPPHRVQNFIKKLNLRFSVFVDETMKVANDYSVMGVPTFILIDKSGKIVFTGHSLPRGYKELLAQ